MSKPKGPVWVTAQPPLPVLHAVNRVMRPVLASPLGNRIRGVMLLEFAGRRSGRTIRVPVNYYAVDGAPAAFTDAPWALNFAGGAPVTVRHQGRVRRGTGTLVTSPEEVGRGARKAMDNGAPPRRLGLGVAKGHDPSASELAALGPQLGSMVRFQL